MLLGACSSGVAIEGQDDPSAFNFEYGSATELGRIQNEELVELSGIVAGGVNQDVLWVHNDRGNLPRLYALDQKGKTVATYSLDRFNEDGAMSGDWEDIARVPTNEGRGFDLYIGDIGNNALAPKDYQILVVSEPIIDATNTSQVITTGFKTIQFQFPGVYACNSECLLVHPVTGQIFIIAKAVKKGNQSTASNMVWSLPAVSDGATSATATLELPSIPAIAKEKVTGGDISADGQFLILRTNKATAYLWQLKKDQSLKETLSTTPKPIQLAKEKGGEAICFALDHTALFTVYDGKQASRPLHRYPKK